MMPNAVVACGVLERRDSTYVVRFLGQRALHPMLGTFKKSPEHLQALDRVKGWTRDRFDLSDDDAILVSEVACTYPGCVPLETVVGFWTEGATHHHFKLFKPIVEVVDDDLPPAWLKDSLVVSDEYRCSCC